MPLVTRARQSFRILVAGSLFVLTLTVSGLLVVTSLADRAAHKTAQIWDDYSVNVQDKIALLTQLHGENGLKDLLGDLAAYVQTQDPALSAEMDARMTKVRALLEKYGNLRLADEETFALRALTATLTSLEDKLKIARHMAERGVSPADVAAVVPPDDSTSTMALSLLLDSWTEAEQRQKARISASMEIANALTRSTLLAVPVLILATILVGWQAWRYVAITREAERQRAEALSTEALYRDLVEGSLQGLLIHTDFKPLFANAAFARMFGYTSPSEALTLPSFLDLVAEEERDDINLVHGKIAAGTIHTWTGRVHCRTLSGETIWVEEMVRQILWNSAPAVQMTLLDVTDRVAHEQNQEMERTLTEQQAQEVVALAEELDAALQLAEEQKARLQRLSITDPLTGAFNRRHFLDRAQQELVRMGRHPDHTVSVVMMDLDLFKAINDTYGHGVGDETLRAFTAASAETLRENDVFGRLGGEEFAALLPETNLAEALIVAERLRERVADLRIPTEAGKDIRITVSLGVAEISDPALPFDSVLSRADAALYESKRNGRNRVTAAPSHAHESGNSSTVHAETREA